MGIPKDKIPFWLESFREGDVEDKRYQAKMIDSFVQAVYLYDHELRVAFNFTKNRDSVTIPFEEVDELCPDSAPESSYKLPNGPPRRGEIRYAGQWQSKTFKKGEGNNICADIKNYF